MRKTGKEQADWTLTYCVLFQVRYNRAHATGHLSRRASQLAGSGKCSPFASWPPFVDRRFLLGIWVCFGPDGALGRFHFLFNALLFSEGDS